MLHLLGLDNATGRWYLFWSGSGADLAFIGAFVSVTRRHTCDVLRCWRIGRFPIKDTAFVVCRKHHPDPSSTHYVPVLMREGEPTTPLRDVDTKG